MFSDATNLIAEAEGSIKHARDILRDLDGSNRNGGLTITEYGAYVLVDDGADRWISTYDDFDSALFSVITAALNGKYYSEDRREARKDAYDALCSDCPCLYSRIGSGAHNNDLPSLVVELESDLDEDQIAEIFEEIGEEVPESEEADA